MFSRVGVSEEEIARRQLEEDMRLYGSWLEPPDAVDVDELNHLANLPSKRSAPDFETAVDRPAQARRRIKIKAFNQGAVTAMDWNSGASRLDAWLNQSAVPLAACATEMPDQGKSNDLTAQELEEIKVFRNVHVAMATTIKEYQIAVDDFNGLESDAQVYCRNIRDR